MQRPRTTKAQLCGCNNCEAIMVDENPSDQKELTVKDKYLQEMVQLNESEDAYDPIEGSEHTFWACPNCKTDAYLTDITSREHLQSFIKSQKK